VTTLIQGAGRQWAGDVSEGSLDCRDAVFPICERGPVGRALRPLSAPAQPPPRLPGPTKCLLAC